MVIPILLLIAQLMCSVRNCDGLDEPSASAKGNSNDKEKLAATTLSIGGFAVQHHTRTMEARHRVGHQRQSRDDERRR